MSDTEETATLSTSTAVVSWDDCVGPARWLREPLQHHLRYPHPFPVQQAVIPTITRALLSGVPNDVSLTAPTGSGKTLCYLLPLLRLLTETKRGVDDNALRCLILVPSQTLGEQVHRELQRLTRPTSIKLACICGEGSGASAGGEAAQLVRQVVLPRRPVIGPNVRSAGVPAVAGELQESEPQASVDALNDCEDAQQQQHAQEEEEEDFGNHLGSAERTNDVEYFSNVDVIVATPQRLLHHLDHTRGLRLADLRLLVIDEADQVLTGTFASQVQKVNARYEAEVAQQQRVAQQRQQESYAFLASQDGAEALRVNAPALTIGGSAVQLHKVLCSATLSSRISRISQVKLRNCSFYVLDSNGTKREEDATVNVVTAAVSDDRKGLKKGKHASTATTMASVVRTQFALPPTLQEHVIFVKDSYRPAVLLKLLHQLRQRIAATLRRARAKATKRATETGPRGEEDGVEEKKDEFSVSRSENAATAEDADYPTVEERAGTGVLVFCATAEEARVMSHFLSAAGVTGIVEFTTLSTEAERRRALLQHTTSAAIAEGEAEVSCVVASDALMRGIDIPNVGHVIMYHPPEAVSQYVHRAGRTARAMRPGHVHLLLSKAGPSGGLEDGEVALYKRLSQSLSRTLPTSYERTFFRFAKNPHKASASAAAVTATAGAKSADVEPTTITTIPEQPVKAHKDTVGTAEWWVTQSRVFLEQSQHQLQRRWASVLESAAAQAAAAEKAKREVAQSEASVRPAAAAHASVTAARKRPSAETSAPAAARVRK